MNISITITGDQKIIEGVTAMASQMKDYSSELSSTGDFLKEYYGAYPFVSQGQIWGKPWAPLSPAYAVEKAKKYRGRGILIASGKMQQSFSFMSTTNYVRIFNNTEYFQYHQLGTSKMPQRLVMSLNEETNRGIEDIFKEAIQIKINSLL